MTILINEIYIWNDINESVIVNVADSRLTVGGNFHENKPKLFNIPYFNACVGYFGLAVTGNKYRKVGKMNEEKLREITDAAAKESIDIIKERIATKLSQSIEWEVANKVQKEVAAFVEKEIIPAVQSELTSNKEMLMNVARHAAKKSCEVLQKGMDDKIEKMRTDSYKMSAILKQMFER